MMLLSLLTQKLLLKVNMKKHAYLNSRKSTCATQVTNKENLNTIRTISKSLRKLKLDKPHVFHTLQPISNKSRYSLLPRIDLQKPPRPNPRLCKNLSSDIDCKLVRILGHKSKQQDIYDPSIDRELQRLNLLQRNYTRLLQDLSQIQQSIVSYSDFKVSRDPLRQ